MPPGLIDDLLRYIELSSLGMKKALDEVDAIRRRRHKAASASKPLLSKLVALGLVAPHQKRAAWAMLNDHADTVNLFNALVDKYAAVRSEKRAADGLGRPVDPSTVGYATPEYDSLNSPWIGRRTTEKKASDLAILRVLGNP